MNKNTHTHLEVLPLKHLVSACIRAETALHNVGVEVGVCVCVCVRGGDIHEWIMNRENLLVFMASSDSQYDRLQSHPEST